MPNLRTKSSPTRLLLAASLLLAVLSTQAARGQTLTTLYSFGGVPGDGFGPGAGLVFDAQGNLYGTTEGGGPRPQCECGTAFVLSPGGVEKRLHSFFNASDAGPGQIVLGGDGNLYVPTTGTQLRGHFGVIVELEKPKFTKVRKVYNFSQGSGKYGGSPVALIADAQGNVRGAFSGSGGDPSDGYIFEITPQGTFNNLHTFAGPPNEGAYPEALIADEQGNLFGTTRYGGQFFDNGTVFQLMPGTLTTIYNFCAQSGCTDGAQPGTRIIFDGQGNLYGTTYFGGAYGLGTVFEITSSGVEKVLYSFTGSSDGEHPDSGVVMDNVGNLYGTTPNGGAYGDGTIFEVTAPGAETVLHTFSGPDGLLPYGGVILDGQGNLYGTTFGGGTYNAGTVFKLTP